MPRQAGSRLSCQTLGAMKTAFVLQHLHVLPSGEEDFKMIGLYKTMADAEAAITRLRLKPGFSTFPRLVKPDDLSPNGFYIDEYVVGQDHWSEGFETI